MSKAKKNIKQLKIKEKIKILKIITKTNRISMQRTREKKYDYNDEIFFFCK